MICPGYTASVEPKFVSIDNWISELHLSLMSYFPSCVRCYAGFEEDAIWLVDVQKSHKGHNIWDGIILECDIWDGLS